MFGNKKKCKVAKCTNDVKPIKVGNKVIVDFLCSKHIADMKELYVINKK